MKITEEFKVSNASGKMAILQHLVPGLTYLDFGFTKLPRSFNGFRVKDTDRTAEKQSDGSFKLSDSADIYNIA
jgi:hypothetical protein